MSFLWVNREKQYCTSRYIILSFIKHELFKMIYYQAIFNISTKLNEYLSKSFKCDNRYQIDVQMKKKVRPGAPKSLVL